MIHSIPRPALRSVHNSTEVDDRLLSYLRSELEDQKITFTQPPTPVTGGYDTDIYRFQVREVPDELSRQLILRVFPQGSNPHRALFESVIQNALADMGYPSPRVFFSSRDEDIFGASFMIMEFMPGHPMMDEPEDDIPEMLAKAHLHLHGIDTDPIRDAIQSAGIEQKYISFEWRHSWLQEKIDAGGYDWLLQGSKWLDDNHPEGQKRLAAIHGDFHPLNILVDEGRVSGVLDWSGFLLADPAYDIAITMVLGTVAAPSEWLQLIRLYYDYYREESPVEDERVGYYEAFRCLWALLEGVEGHLAWSRPEVMRRLAEHFKKITEVTIRLPS